MMNALFNKFFAILLTGLLFSTTVFAQTDNQPQKQLSQKEIQDIAIALEGYDVVSYFDFSSPKKGEETYQALYQGKRYLFINAENQEKFAAAPEYFLPEFEEFCGCAASENRRVKADASVFKITNGRLVLFHSEAALSKWNEDEDARYKKAQDFWKYENGYSAGNRFQDKTTVRLFSF